MTDKASPSPSNNPEQVVITMPQTEGRQIIPVTVPVTAPIAIAAPTVCTAKVPQLFYCTVCQKTLTSNVQYVDNEGLFFCLMILFCIFCFPFAICLCIFSPLFFKRAIHTCPQCGREVGLG